MKKLVMVCLVALAACVAAGTTDTNTLSGAEVVLTRHDVYATALLEEPAKTEALTESGRVRKAIADAKAAGVERMEVASIRGDARLVIGRHDQWVKDDPKLDDLQKRTYLRSSALLKQLLED